MHTILRPRVFVAMSGGVDSSVAAFLLKRQGHDVYGVHIKEWAVPGSSHCAATDEDRQMAARVAAYLGIPFAVWDFRDAYKKEVVDYMVQEYARGRTPNPDVMCNRRIKFGIFLKEALAQNADFIATGHYVKIQNTKISAKGGSASGGKNQNHNSKFKIFRAKDANKDQSYFLWTLMQEQLRHCLFPIGEYEKKEVREIAKNAGIPSWDKKDSQGICFTGGLELANFLRMYIPKKEGVAVTTAGKEVGTHDGAQFLTIGQRHGINVNAEKPLYIVEKNMATNTITLGEESDHTLYKKTLAVENINWISGAAPELPLLCEARIRYRQPLQSCIVEQKAEGSKPKAAPLKATFTKAQRAVTPGQSAVFYTKSGQLLGGGIILG